MELIPELLQECQTLGYCNTTSPLVTPAGACKFCRYVLNATLAEWTLAAFYGLDYDQATISPQSLGPSTAPMQSLTQSSHPGLLRAVTMPSRSVLAAVERVLGSMLSR